MTCVIFIYPLIMLVNAGLVPDRIIVGTGYMINLAGFFTADKHYGHKNKILLKFFDGCRLNNEASIPAACLKRPYLLLSLMLQVTRRLHRQGLSIAPKGIYDHLPQF